MPAAPHPLAGDATNDEAHLYRHVARCAARPPGGLPDGWTLWCIRVQARYHPGHGPQWRAIAEYARPGQAHDTWQLVGAGCSVRAALTALWEHLADPMTVNGAAGSRR